MSPLPKVILLSLLSAILLVPVVISSDRQVLEPPKIKALSGYRAEAIGGNLDHPSLITFDQAGRLLVVEAGVDPQIIRFEPTGVRTRLTAPHAFGQALPIDSIAYLNGRVYVGHGGVTSIVKPDGTLDTPPKLDRQLPPNTASATNLSIIDLVQKLGIAPVASVTGPDGATYLSDLGGKNSSGVIWRVVKAETELNQTPSTNLVIFLLSVVMIITATILLLRRVFRRVYREIKVRRMRRGQIRAVQLTNVSAWPALPARPVRPIRWM